MPFNKTKIQKRAIQLFLSNAKEFLLYGGSRSGKTFVIVYVQVLIALKFPGSRHLIARFRLNAALGAIWNDTLKKVLKTCFQDIPVRWNNSSPHYIEFPNGSQIYLVGLDDAARLEKILGMEFLTIFLNEASQISYEAYNIVKTRLAQKIKGARNLFFIDENPPSKKHWTYRIFFDHIDPVDRTALDAERYACTQMNPIDNLDNISDEYMQILKSMPKRKRDRFLKGEFADDTENALWTDELISGTRLQKSPPLRRIVVAIDPAVTAKDDSDETGIVAAGVGFDNHYYILEDVSGTYTANDWGKTAIALHKKRQGDRIVGEVNNGGDLIEALLRGIDENIPYKSVWATRDKYTRAEPIAALYEQGKVHHIGEHFELEFEMTTWEAKKGEKSPNRIDALVWALTELSDGYSGEMKDLFAD